MYEQTTSSDRPRQLLQVMQNCLGHSISCVLPRRRTSIRQLPVPLLSLSSTPNSITVILSTINALGLNYPVSSRSRTLLLVMLLKHLSPLISLPSYAVSTGSGSQNAWNTISSHLPTKFSQLRNLHITPNLIYVQCPRSTRSSSVVTLVRLPSSCSLKMK